MQRSKYSLVFIFVFVSALFLFMLTSSSLEHITTSKVEATEYDSIVIFRNDDVAPWTEKEELKPVNEIFIEQQVPLTQGIVPYKEEKNEVLSKHHKICQYLRETKTNNSELFDYSLHGYNHLQETSFYGRSEVGGLDEEQQRQKIVEGKKVIQNCTGEVPRAYVPPFNTYDNTTVNILAEEEFDLVSGGKGFQEVYFGKENLYESENITHLPSNSHLVKDWSTNELYDLETLKERYDSNKADNRVHVQLFHYFSINEDDERLNKIADLIQYMKQDQTKFMTLEQFAIKYENDEIERTDEGWLVK